VTGQPSELRVERRPALTKPVLVASFRGWNDGGQSASMATSFLTRVWHGESFASIDGWCRRAAELLA